MTGSDLDVSWNGRHVVVTMPAEIDVTNSASVDTVLTGLVAKRPEIITADMTMTVFCDSSGIHALARAHRLTSSHGGELRLVIGASPIIRVFQLTGLDQVVPIYADVSQSLAAPPGACQA